MLSAQLNWTFLLFLLFKGENTYMSLSNKGNHNIILSRENGKGRLPGDIFNVFSDSCIFQLAYSVYRFRLILRILSLGIQSWWKGIFDFFHYQQVFVSKFFAILSTSVQHKTFLQASYSISHSVLAQFTSQEFSLQYWAKFYFFITKAKPFNFQ